MLTVYQILRSVSKPQILELGTTRSFRSGFIERNSFDPDITSWDWGAGCFTYAIKHLLPDAVVTSIDPDKEALGTASTISLFAGHEINCIHTDSTSFLESVSDTQYDLIYMDHSEAGFDDRCAVLHRNDAAIILRKGLVKEGGFILIDDVNEKYGKGMYSIPWPSLNGFSFLSTGCYQQLLRCDQHIKREL